MEDCQLFSTVPGLRAMLNEPPLDGSDEGGEGEAEAYDPRKRDPKYAHASASPLWELVSPSFLSVQRKSLS